jgi:adenosylhomocysteine nucleosidase
MNILIASFLVLAQMTSFSPNVKYAVVISADMEWKAVKRIFPEEVYQSSAWGEFFFKKISDRNVLFFHEGWGKVAAAGGTQFVIDTFKPEIIINLGTCGGIAGKIDRFEIVLVDKTIIYDIKEAMGDSKEAIDSYSTTIDLSWLGTHYPQKVIKALMVSGDRDLQFDEIERLKTEYGAIAGDWESGAIAYVAQKNKVKTLILRGVGDVVSAASDETYNNFDLFAQRADTVMADLLKHLPAWIDYIDQIDKK